MGRRTANGRATPRSRALGSDLDPSIALLIQPPRAGLSTIEVESASPSTRSLEIERATLDRTARGRRSDLVAKIAYLTPNYFSDESYIGGGERYPLNLARGIVEGSGGRHSVEILSFGPTSRSYRLAPGLSVRVWRRRKSP